MQITNIQNINFNAHHKNVTKPILPPNTITIRNFHEVDETLMRGGGLPEEAQWANKLGMNFHWLPMHSTNNPTISDVNRFFQITDDARNKGEKVFIHCRHGADRTGVYSALYRVRNQNVKLSDVIRELMAYGHDANHNPNIIPFIIDFKESLNPLNKIMNAGKDIVQSLLKKGI